MDQSRFHRLLARTFALPFILMAVLVGTLLWLNERQSQSLSWVDHTDEVIAQGRRLMRLIIDQESGLRGYLLTGDPEFLRPYDRAQAEIDAGFTNLIAQVSEDPAQLQRVIQLRGSYQKWQGYTREMIAARQNGADYQSTELNLREKAAIDMLREEHSSLVAEEQKLRDLRVAEARHDGYMVRIVGVVLGMLLALVLAFATRRQMKMISRSFESALLEARRRSDAQAETRKELDAVLASMEEGLYQLDTEGRLVYLNTAAERLLGFSLPEIAGKNMHEVVHSRTPDGHGRSWQDCPLLNVVRRGVAYHVPEDYLVRRDGNFLPVETTSAPIVLNGKVTGAVVTFRDLTERKRSEQALRASDKLATAGRLAATIAHEINNPLDSVSNLLYLLRARESDSDSQALIDLARGELDRIVQITRNMLSLHREAQAPLPVKMSEIVEGLLRLFEGKLQKARIRVQTRYENEREVQVFPGEMRQVFSNLLGNAIEAMEIHGGKILIHAYSGQEWGIGGRQGMRVTMADNGPGIPAEYCDRIFEPFFTTKAEKGTGLGLWVTAGIVQKHEGTIRVHSTTRPGRSGTAFAVFLPYALKTAQQLQRQSQHMPSPAA